MSRISKPWKCGNCGLETRGFGIYSHQQKCKSFEEAAHSELDALESGEASKLWHRVNLEMVAGLGLQHDQNTFKHTASARCIAKQYLWLADHAAKFIADRIDWSDWKKFRRFLQGSSVMCASNRGTRLVHEALDSHFTRLAGAEVQTP
jgi:hypothetical protein